MMRKNLKKKLKKDVIICMILTGEINNSEELKLTQIEYNSSGKIFIHKIYYNLDDFDCLVDEKTFDLFFRFSEKRTILYSWNNFW